MYILYNFKNLVKDMNRKLTLRISVAAVPEGGTVLSRDVATFGGQGECS